MIVRISIAWVALLCASTVGTVATALSETSALASLLSKRMRDGKLWTTDNLSVNVGTSYCYQDLDSNCHRYGRLYTWKSALLACRALGGGWRLPTDLDWRGLAKRYGGVSEDSHDDGRAAYAALSPGGRSGFDALLAGGRVDGQFNRQGAHGFYWTQSKSVSDGAWFYNFARGNQALYRQSGGDEEMAISVRCVSD